MNEIRTSYDDDFPDPPDLHVSLEDWVRSNDCVALVRFTSAPNFQRFAEVSVIETYKGKLPQDRKIYAGPMLGMGTSQLFYQDELNLIFLFSTGSLSGMGGRFRVREIDGCRWLEPVIQDFVEFGDAKKLTHNGVELACFEDVIAKIKRVVGEGQR
jgi:hypothetical protein